MKPSELVPAINATICHLDWLNADRYQGALRLVAAVPIDLEQIGASAGGDAETRDRRVIGGHSDPTGDAVAGSADRQARLADRAEIVCNAARTVRGTVYGYTPTNAAGTITGALVDLTMVLHGHRTITAWQAPSEPARLGLHHAVQLCHDETSTLRYEVEQVLRYSATVAAGRPAQRERRYCASCSRGGLEVDIYVDRYAHFCRFCGDYKASEGRVPPDAACIWLHRHGKNPRGDQIARWIFEESLPSPVQRRRGA